MLTIRLAPMMVDDRPIDRAISVPMTLVELFRTARVVGERAVLLEPRPGYLINLAHVESIEDDALAQEDRALADDVERIQREAMGLSRVQAAEPEADVAEPEHEEQCMVLHRGFGCTCGQQ